MMIITFIVGLALGIIFFGGLWFTVKKALGTPYAPLWFFGSLMIRTAIILVGFYYVSSEGLPQVASCLIGFVIARFLVFRITKQLEQKHIPTQS